jgi:hypothetical protein
MFMTDSMDYQMQAQQQQPPQDIFLVGFLDKSAALLRQIKDTAQLVIVCRAQIDQLHERCNVLLDALRSDSSSMDGPVLVKATDQVELLLRKVLGHVRQMVDYGRPKSFIMRRDIAAHLEGLNIEIDKCAYAFETKPHHSLHQWQQAHHKASLRDETEAFHTIGDILGNPAHRHAIASMGKNAIFSLRQSIEIGSLAGHISDEQRRQFNSWLDQMQ